MSHHSSKSAVTHKITTTAKHVYTPSQKNVPTLLWLSVCLMWTNFKKNWHACEFVDIWDLGARWRWTFQACSVNMMQFATCRMISHKIPDSCVCGYSMIHQHVYENTVLMAQSLQISQGSASTYFMHSFDTVIYSWKYLPIFKIGSYLTDTKQKKQLTVFLRHCVV